MSYFSKPVKIRRNQILAQKFTLPQKFTKFTTIGFIDIHFHGAFGIDLMTATHDQLNILSIQLWKKGIAGFCPTTLSSSPEDLRKAVFQLGQWIRQGNHPGAIPLGIHLEGPFLHQDACGAHPPQLIRRFDQKELTDLWEASQHTLKLITLAPEFLSPVELKKLCAWAKAKKIILSIGHSKISESEAEKAFKLGFSGVTHAWNALHFHHRSPGVLGAAIGRKDTFLELIIDQVHISPTVIKWTMQLHPPQSICFISDCVSAGGWASSKKSKRHRFGSIQAHFHQGACRLDNGQLAGGGLLLSDSFQKWLNQTGIPNSSFRPSTLKKLISSATIVPLNYLQISTRSFKNRQIEWKMGEDNRIHVFPIDSRSVRR